MAPVFANPMDHPALAALRDEDRDRVVALVRRDKRVWRAAIMVVAVVMALFVWPVMGRLGLVEVGLDLDQKSTWYSIALNVLVFWGGLIGWVWAGVFVARRVPANMWMGGHIRSTPCPGCLYPLSESEPFVCPECGERVTLRGAEDVGGVARPAV